MMETINLCATSRGIFQTLQGIITVWTKNKAGVSVYVTSVMTVQIQVLYYIGEWLFHKIPPLATQFFFSLMTSKFHFIPGHQILLLCHMSQRHALAVLQHQAQRQRDRNNKVWFWRLESVESARRPWFKFCSALCFHPCPVLSSLALYFSSCLLGKVPKAVWLGLD